MSDATPLRADRDYIFDFWTAFGWTLLSCGFYGFYVVYKLVERMRDHNRRRLAQLDYAYRQAWERAVANGTDETERPRFERMAGHLAVLRQLDADFREPAVWTVLTLVGSGVVQIIVLILNDMDLIKHQTAAGAIEADLAALAGRPAQFEPPKQPHNYVGRAVATVLTCGIYGYWWLADVMREGNDHFRRDWAWEDAYFAG